MVMESHGKFLGKKCGNAVLWLLKESLIGLYFVGTNFAVDVILIDNSYWP